MNKKVKLSVILPVLNEENNVALMVDAILKLNLENYNIIFVDDGSTDNTIKNIRALQQTHNNVFVIRRFKRRGLASAVIEGALFSDAEYFCVIDADMQHDETLIPKMLHACIEENLDVVVGSRYIDKDATISNDWSWLRKKISSSATKVSNLVLKNNFVTDPMSGFFMVKRDLFEEYSSKLKSDGFKILFDFLSVAPKLAIKELPYFFKTRQFGESKLSLKVAWFFFSLVFQRFLNIYFSDRFLTFALVGSFGVVIHMILLKTLLAYNLTIALSQGLSAFLVMGLNFSLNNKYTFKEKSFKGLSKIWGGTKFIAACLAGALISASLADLLNDKPFYFAWWLAGLIGILAGSLWNYMISSKLVWNEEN